MKKFLLGVSIAAIGFATAAKADLVSVTFSSYGLDTLPSGYDVVTDFSSDAGLTGSYRLVSGNVPYYHLAPATSASTQDQDQYLAVLKDQSATLALTNDTSVAVYIGSWDTYNKISFSNGLSYSGTELAKLTDTSPDYGKEFAASANGWLVFTFTSAVSSVTFSSPTSNAFEVAEVAGLDPPSSGGVPEASTWGMIGLGFLAMGLGGYRRSARPARSPAFAD